ncbi:Aminotransferase-like mobile domain containing protein [Parasponia andersonii]|uniref:Aminotransferase-like mobile domain containing protein n=1 Tax=Parasponia andersonii TaxID=3476 RepID=A0A2P5E435_PARAD|nr:Aminotransferase-like mobile domain containing protein [Parasponia andersonii]
MREDEDHFFDTGLAQSFRTDQGESKRGDFLYDDSDNPFGPTPGSILRFRHDRGDLPISDFVFLTKTHSMQGWRNGSSVLRLNILSFGNRWRWCPETHTFICSWGEFTVTLEDVCALYQLPLCGSHDLLSQTPSPEEQGLVDELERRHQRLGKVIFAKWAHYFFYHYQGESTVSTLELAGTLYRRMDQFVSDMIRSVGRYQKSISILRASEQERRLFGSLAPYLWRWESCCCKRIEANMLDNCREFSAYGYPVFDIYNSKGPKLDAEEGQNLTDSADISSVCRLLICAPRTLPAMGLLQYETNSIVWSPMIYSPHRVMRQFGYHQHAPCFEKIKTVEQASQALVNTNLSQLRSTLENIRAPFPAYWSESDASNKVSSRFYSFWKDLIRDFHEFEKGSSDASFAIDRAVSIGDFTLRLPPPDRPHKRKMILPVKGRRAKRRRNASFAELGGWNDAAAIQDFNEKSKFGTDQERGKQAIDNRDEVHGDNSSPRFKGKESSSSAIPKGNSIDLSAADDPVTNISIDPSAKDFDPQAIPCSFLMPNMTRDNDDSTTKLVEAATTPNLTDSIGNSKTPDSPKISFHDILSDNLAAHTPAISHSNVPNSSLRTPQTVENIMSPNKSRPGISLQEPEHSDEQLASTNRRTSITEEELLPYFRLYESQDPSLTPQPESLRPFRRAIVIRAIGEIIIVFADTPVEEVSSFHRDLAEERWEELCLWGLKLPIMEELIDTARKPTRFDEVCDKILTLNSHGSPRGRDEDCKTSF